MLARARRGAVAPPTTGGGQGRTPTERSLPKLAHLRPAPLSLLFGAWSKPAAVRAVRAAVLVPALLALSDKVVAAPQVATYATFGGFANFVMASFAGGRRQQLEARLALGLVGTVLLTIGTLVAGSAPVAGPVTLVLAFLVLVAGVAAPNVAAGGFPAMLVYVLSAASPGTAGMVPSRLAGWWLATAVATVVVVAMTPRKPGSALRSATAEAVAAMAREAAALATGTRSPELRQGTQHRQSRLAEIFRASPGRPTSLAAADHALGNLVESLSWVAALLHDTSETNFDLGPDDRALIGSSAQVLNEIAARLRHEEVTIDVSALEAARRQRAVAVKAVKKASPSADDESSAHSLFHSRTLALAVRTAAADALVATGQEKWARVSELRRSWLRAASTPLTTGATSSGAAGGAASPAGMATVSDVAARPAARASAAWRARASVRSVWARNSARAAVAVAAAVTVATLTNVQHGFWVVLGTLSVLRTTAVATSSNALKGLFGTTVGVIVGGAVVVGFGSGTVVLWAVLPVAVLIAAYTPGVSPFAAGQAAFSVLIVILYNLLVPVGWKVGAVRLEDVALGVGISLAAGVLVWPRGASSAVAGALNDCLVSGARYLREAVQWALGLRGPAPGLGPEALEASIRLDDALRAYLAEPGPKPLPPDDLWSLMGAAKRLRLTAFSLSDLPPPPDPGPPAEALLGTTDALAAWYEMIGAHVRYGQPSTLSPLHLHWPPRPAGTGPAAAHCYACHAYVEEHIRHLYLNHAELIRPALLLRQALMRPWWHVQPEVAENTSLVRPLPSP